MCFLPIYRIIADNDIISNRHTASLFLIAGLAKAYTYQGRYIMSELQNDSVESDLDESADIENQDNGVDLATTSESEHEQTPEVDEEAVKQEAINKAINKSHFKQKQAERDLQAANNRIADFERGQREQMAAQVGDIPDMPDPFDDDFDNKVQARDEAIIAKTNFNYQNQAFQQQQQTQQQNEAQARQKEVQDSVIAYSNKATELGIKNEELQAAASTVAQYGLSDELTLHILADSDGPLITKYLAANSQDGIKLAQMSPYSVGSFLDGIKVKAGALKPKTSKTPNPTENLQGKGHKSTDSYKNIGNAKFE